MNVGSSEVPARPVGRGAGAPAAVETNPAGGTADATQTADVFLAVLAQAVAPGAVAPTSPATLPNDGSGADEDEPSPTGDIDWVVPFLAPPGTPTPVDLELPAGDEASTLPGVADAPDGPTPTPLPRLVNDVTVQEFDAALESVDARPNDASSAQAAAAAPPRIEAAANGAHAVVRTIPAPVSDHRWPAQVGHEVRILVERGVQAATLKMTPEHLGPVEVRIDIVNDKANVVFGAAQAETRAALTDAIPKLREMFAGAGLMLGDAGVRHQAPDPQPRPGGRANFGGLEGDDPAVTTPAAVSAARIGLVDAYA